MSIARHHNEWLSLLEVSGPFLSMPVLLRVFPQGLDALDRDQSTELRLAYEEWVDNQNSLRPETAIHSIWVRYVLENVLGFERNQVQEGPAIAAHLKATIAEQGETLRPDLAISDDPARVDLLVNIYPFGQGLDKVLHDHRWKASPATRMMELLRATGQPLGVVTNGEQWMLVHAPKGETTTFVSWYAALWCEEPITLRALNSLLGARRFFGVADEDTLAGMLKASADNQQEVTDQLGYQVRRAVEVLTRALDKADQDRGRRLLNGIEENDLYEAALTVMMRLVFLFSAEERGLLLLGEPIYDQNYAVSTLRAQLREIADQQGEEVLERRFDAWCRLTATFRAVYGGIQHDRLNLPAYGGSLFDPDKYPFLEGRLAGNGATAEPLPINNRTVLHLLESLQILRVKVPGGGAAEPRRLSFRSLDVEQIGHVYEGLLDHIAVLASETVLGLSGTREKEPEIGLSTLKREHQKGTDALVKYLQEQTGRSASVLKKGLEATPDAFTASRLKIACNNDEGVYQSILPYAGLIRADDFGYPTVFVAGSMYITAGATRRATGTHYTPRSLTEPIVQHTLEPLVYEGPAEGWPKEQWRLRAPGAILDLKVCDMAMGSAGFLVQVIRYLSERLVEGWEALTPKPSPSGRAALRITPEGKPATGAPGELIIPSDDEERLVLARRLVADRCIYGVDKNPLAVEIAKLSIWLTTMDKGRPFTFLDHALKCGDSLVGADEDLYRKWAFSLKGAQFTLYLTTLEEFVETAHQKRKELESFTVLDVRDSEHKAALLREADEAMARVKLGCDLLVGTRLLGLKPAEQETLLAHLLWDYVAGLPMDGYDAQRALHAAHKEHAFHWPFEFPEIFVNNGCNAMVGNPPFLGSSKITGIFGNKYREYVVDSVAGGKKGPADLCAYFVLRASRLIKMNGYVGLITTSSISEGDTREVCLEKLLLEGNSIYRAASSQTWPGTASVTYSAIWYSPCRWHGNYFLNNEQVVKINAYLKDEVDIEEKPLPLLANSESSYQGSVILGKGFILTKVEADTLISKNKNNEQVIWPYLIGEEVNSSPTHSHTHWVINFWNWPLSRSTAPGDYFGPVAEDFPDCLKIIREKVKPQRDKDNRKVRRERWWQFGELATGLYLAIKGKGKVLAIAKQATKYVAFGFVPEGTVFSHALAIITRNDYASFAVLSSNFHEVWSRAYASYNLALLRYSPSDLYETFPFPIQNINELEAIGKEYSENRSNIMLKANEGLTDIYNRFNSPKEINGQIIQLRELHVKMDDAVSAAYGWSDLELGHGFHKTPQGVRFTISEAARREVLARLLRLNHERYEEEVKQGLHDKGLKGKEKNIKSKNKNKGRVIQEDPDQYKLF